VEKRHEQLKSVFGVAPVWLKNVGRIESLLWLYYVVELVGALAEREVRRRMEERGRASLALYPEGRPCEAPTANGVFGILEGHRRHRLLDGQGRELRAFEGIGSEGCRAGADSVVQLHEHYPSPFGRAGRGAVPRPRPGRCAGPA
jgi:hypothetical protein